MPAESRSLKEIFLAALAIAPAERAAWLEQACGPNAELRQRVELMLVAHDTPQSLLDRPGLVTDRPDAVTGACTDATAERPGTMIGPYKLLQQIGEGGMGVVWMAEQAEPVKRKVALKVIKPGMDSRQVIARFQAERQALAMMDHVNIARVYDGGTTGEPSRVSDRVADGDDTRLLTQLGSPRPYFVMELVHGVPITKYCDDNHLTPRERLELFVPVCQAIQHAHQKGIIHRDIKPSNVMVTLYDGKPVPKVIDFGVAKATEQQLTERTLFTQYGTMVGTLEYMSPEQAEMSALGVDTRSDIYSLGVLLYELLTGSTPLTHKRMKEVAYGEILRMIKEEEPPKPSTRLSDSGEALASISAQRHTEPAKLTKLVKGELDWIVMKTLEKDRGRRYETASGFAADVQRYLNDEAVQACPPSALYRFRKFARRNKVGLGVAGMMLFFLVLLGSGAGWALRDREAREREIAHETARKVAQTEDGIRQALDRGTTSRAELHAILKRPGGVQQLLNQPAGWELLIKTAQGELAQARQMAVRAEGSLDGHWTQAMHKFEKQLTSDQADFDLARRLEKIHLDIAPGKDGRFDYRAAADEYSRVLANYALLTGDPVAVAARLGSSPITDQLVAALDNWASIAFFLRNEGLAEQLLSVARQASPDAAWGDRLRQLKVWRNREALDKLVTQAPIAGLSPELLHLVGLLLRNVDSSQMESWLRQAQAEYPTDFWLNFSLANALSKTSPMEAAGFYRAMIAVRPGSCAAYINFGIVLRDLQKLPEAFAALTKATALDPKNPIAHFNLGNVLKAQNKSLEAMACYRTAIQLDPKYAHPHVNLGIIYFHQNKLDDAVDSYRTAIDLNPKFAKAYVNLGSALLDQKKLDNAAAAYSTAIDLDPKYASAHYGLGLALSAQGNPEEAVPCYKKALELDPTHANAPIALRNSWNDLIDKAWALANNPNPKLRDPRRAVELGKLVVDASPKDGWAWQRMGWIHYRAGNWEASIKALERSCRLQEGGKGDAFQWLFLAMAHWKADHKGEARKWYDKAIQLERIWPQELRGYRAEAEVLLGLKEKMK